jgi:hypothetical protein
MRFCVLVVVWLLGLLEVKSYEICSRSLRRQGGGRGRGGCTAKIVPPAQSVEAIGGGEILWDAAQKSVLHRCAVFVLGAKNAEVQAK